MATLRRFTPEEDQILREHYLTKTLKELGEMTGGRTENSVHGRLARLGLHVPEHIKKERQLIGIRRGWHKGAEFRFQKGHTPWNKGKRFPGRRNSGCFPKGHTPANYRPVGSERIDVDGYLYVKVEDPRTWKLKHRLVWEEHHGPIPAGMNIMFRDGNKLNCDISNLEMVDNAGKMVRNSMQRYPKEVQLAAHAVGVLHRIIHKIEKQEKQQEL